MNDVPPITLDELRRRNEAALHLSVLAVQRHPDAYRQLRRDAAAVAVGQLDIGAYHHKAKQMVRQLETLCQVGAGTVFVFYRRGLDPGAEGDVRTFRALCRDMLATFDELERWRRRRHHLKRIK